MSGITFIDTLKIEILESQIIKVLEAIKSKGLCRIDKLS